MSSVEFETIRVFIILTIMNNCMLCILETNSDVKIVSAIRT